jgi:anti-sigma-K factor RskA
MTGHLQNEADFELYALGVLEGDEREATESHLRGCRECGQKMAEARGRISLIGFSAPRVEPSPGVKERLMRQVISSAEGREPSPVDDARWGKMQPAGGFFAKWWAAVLVPATVALALATFFLWAEKGRLDAQIEQLHQEMVAQQAQLDKARAMDDLVEAKDTITVSLAPMPGMAADSLNVMYNARMGKMLCKGKLMPAPPEKSYQVWIVPAEGNPISAIVLNPKSPDPKMWMINIPQGVTPKQFAVTLEPAGGMPHPTGPKVLVGPVS